MNREPLLTVYGLPCRSGMKKHLAENSVDSIVTDPPWGIRFMGRKWDYSVPTVAEWREAYRVLKPGGHMLVCCGTRTQHRMVVRIEDAGFEIRDVITWHYGTGFPKSVDVAKAIDKKAGAKRAVVGQRKAAGGGNMDAFRKGEGRPDRPAIHKAKEIPVTAPATEEAAAWEGWGTALKPATEFWTLCRKPLEEDTVAGNVLTHGTGALNIDACRIPYEANDRLLKGGSYGAGRTSGSGTAIFGNTSEKVAFSLPGGRWPANLVLDDYTAALMDQQAPDCGAAAPVKKSNTGKTKHTYGTYQSTGDDGATFRGDAGGASRFFYVAKPGPKERGEGNDHPTVKPVKLMEYLVKLITPAGGTVLDMFVGSGTTVIAADNLGFDCIAFEKRKTEILKINKRIAENRATRKPKTKALCYS